MYVCSLHFLPSDYFHPGIPTRLHRLKPGAVPSMNIPQRKHELSILKPTDNNAVRRRERAKHRANKKLVRYMDKHNPATSSHSLAESSGLGRTVLEHPTPQRGTEQAAYNIDVLQATVEVPTGDLGIFESRILANCSSVSSVPAVMENIDASGNVTEALRELQTSSVNVDEQKTFANKNLQVNTMLDMHQTFNLMDLLRTDQDLNIFTGIASFKLLETIALCVDELHPNTCKLLKTDAKIVLVMTKLKTAVSFACIAILFQISKTTCRTLFSDSIIYLSQVMKCAVMWPTKEQVLNNMPKCFEKYTGTRIVLDCTEVPVEKTKCLNCRVLTYSHYYGTNTIKILVGTTPGGLLTFVSKVYGGRASDKMIFEESGLLDLLEPYVDKVMVDKGFRIDDSCAEHGIEIIRPPFLKKDTQLTREASLQMANIARARVHVERGIQRMKLYKILSCKLSWTLLPYIDLIVVTICGFVNMSPPILADERF